MIHVFTPAHLGFCQTALFGETDVFDLAQLGQLQVHLRSKSAVETPADAVFVFGLERYVRQFLRQCRAVCHGRRAFPDKAT